MNRLPSAAYRGKLEDTKLGPFKLINAYFGGDEPSFTVNSRARASRSQRAQIRFLVLLDCIAMPLPQQAHDISRLVNHNGK